MSNWQSHLDYSRRGQSAQTLVADNLGWKGEVIIRHQAGDVVCVSRPDLPTEPIWYYADQLTLA